MLRRIQGVLVGLAAVTLAAPVAVVCAEDPAGSDVPVYSNADLPPLSHADVVLPWSTEAPVLITGVGYDAYRDRNGHDEAWWRDRVAKLDAAIAVAEDELALVYLELESWRDAFPLRAPRNPAVEERAARVTRALDALRVERESLPRKARVAGALPGWLRPRRSPDASAPRE